MHVGAIRKPLLIFCILASIALHLAAVWALYFHPFIYETTDELAGMRPDPTPKIVPKEQEDLLVEKIERALEESLNTVIVSAKTKDNYFDVAEDETLDENDMQLETASYPHPKTLFASEPKVNEEQLVIIPEPSSEFFASMPPLFDPDLRASLADFALEEDFEEPLFFEPEKYASVDFSDQTISKTPPPAAAQAIQDDYTMTDQQFLPSALPTHSSEGLDPKFLASLQKLSTRSKETKSELLFEETFSDNASKKLVLPNAVDYLRSQWIKRSIAESDLPDFDHYGFETAETVASAENTIDLDVDVMLMPSPEGNGKYVFSLTISPEFDAKCQPMKQNFYFILDRSSSIEKHKFSRFKRSVQRAMAALHEGDNFNIYIFDKNVVRLSSKNLPVCPKAIEAAESFLESQNGRGPVGGTQTYSSIEEILPKTFSENELHSVILITDGNTILSSQKQRRSIGQWTDKYNGNVNFYAAASGKGNNLVLLDLLSYSTGGKLVYSETNAGFPRKLVRLVKDLHYPLVKNIAIDAQIAAGEGDIHLYPRNNFLSPMFLGQPYTITGTVDTLCDFTLTLKGKNNNQHLNLRKTISLEDGLRGGRMLEKTWALTQSKICYDHFLKSGKSSHLKQAVQAVAPYKGAIASEQ